VEVKKNILEQRITRENNKQKTGIHLFIPVLKHLIKPFLYLKRVELIEVVSQPLLIRLSHTYK
jgi:hypothetical protein